MSLQACHSCGLIHDVPVLDDQSRAVCTRCQATLFQPGAAERSASRTAATALGAFCLFWPAITLPILQVERFGHRHESSILSGTLDLLSRGSWFVGGVVLLFSVVFPLLKLVLLIELCWLKLTHERYRGWAYRLVEHAGKWSMMDVMLLAFLVMLVKLGKLVEFHFGPAVIAFVGCVTLSMLASLSFSPAAIWDNESSAHQQ